MFTVAFAKSRIRRRAVFAQTISAAFYLTVAARCSTFHTLHTICILIAIAVFLQRLRLALFVGKVSQQRQQKRYEILHRKEEIFAHALTYEVVDKRFERKYQRHNDKRQTYYAVYYRIALFAFYVEDITYRHCRRPQKQNAFYYY